MKKSELAALGKDLKNRSAPEWILAELRSIYNNTKGDTVSLEHEVMITKLVDIFDDTEDPSPNHTPGEEIKDFEKDSLVEDTSDLGAIIHSINNKMQDIVKGGDKTLPAKIFKRHAEPAKNLQSQSKSTLIKILEDLNNVVNNSEAKRGRSK